MKGKCNRDDCGLKDGLACELGHSELSKCPHFQPLTEVDAEQATGIVADDGTGQRLPWTGRALGLSDLMLVSARSPASLVGLIGPFNAGKTTFLTSLFVHFAQSGAIGNHSFAGSYTITAWGRLKRYTDWPAAKGPTFPPHTPDTGERVPSILHLAFREASKPVQDLLFTDAPGEWFTRWVRNQTSEDARGAKWIAENATQFLFFVDRAALCGAEIGKVREETLALARVLSENLRGRPIITIWSKSDGTCDETIEAPIRKRIGQLFGEHISLDLHSGNPECLKVLSHLLKRDEKGSSQNIAHCYKSGSAFMAFRE